MLTAALTLEPAAWTPPKAPALGENELLRNAQLWPTPGHGPEDIAFDARGRVVTGLVTGDIVAFSPDGKEHHVIARTGGRPLGIERYGDDLIVCDAKHGLLRVDLRGHVESLATGFEGRPFRFTNNAAIGSDGTIYFSDTSTKYSVGQYRLDLLEHQPRGRLFAYDPKAREVRLLLEGLYFANGVALSQDESFLVVAETATYQLRRYWLKGERAHTSDILVANLPGFPDNVSSNGRGIFWVAFPSPRRQLMDVILPHPSVRRLVSALPNKLQPQARRHGLVLGIDEQGRIVKNLQDPSGRVALLTGAREHDGRLYLGSLTESSVAVVEL